MRILVVDDEPDVVESVRLGFDLQWREVEVIGASSGDAALDAVEHEQPDIVLLDLGLPDVDGFTVLTGIRAFSDVPVVMLTALGAVDDKVKALDAGATDYVTKPFAVDELLARVRAHLRSPQQREATRLSVGGIDIDLVSRDVQRDGRPVQLSAKEFELLVHFMRHPNQLITREMVENHLWNYDFESISNVVDVYVRRLRRKIDDPFEDPKMLETVRGAGYRLRVPLKK